MHLFHTEFPSGGKNLSVFIEDIPAKWNSNVTRCLDCSCSFTTPNSLEPLVHCVLKRSPFVAKSKKGATFVFVPTYTNSLRSVGVAVPLANVVSDNAFTRWKGSRHLVVDAFADTRPLPDYFNFSDQHIVIATNMTVDFVRANRWLNSRHILVPPLQGLREYPKGVKTRAVLAIGRRDRFPHDVPFSVVDDVSSLEKDVAAVAESNFTILLADEQFPPFLIYEIIRAGSVPVLVSGPFLPAYANTYVNYSRISIRSENLTAAFGRIQNFDMRGVAQELAKSAAYLSWPLDGNAKSDNAAGVLLDALNTRHRVIRPILRRTFIGSDEYIP
jgi:hypothetical protein